MVDSRILSTQDMYCLPRLVEEAQMREEIHNAQVWNYSVVLHYMKFTHNYL